MYNTVRWRTMDGPLIVAPDRNTSGFDFYDLSTRQHLCLNYINCIISRINRLSRLNKSRDNEIESINLAHCTCITGQLACKGKGDQGEDTAATRIHQKQLKRSHLCRPENVERWKAFSAFPFLHLSSWLAAKHLEESKVSNAEGDGGRDRSNALGELLIRRKTRDLGEKNNYKKRKLNNKDGKAKRE